MRRWPAALPPLAAGLLLALAAAGRGAAQTATPTPEPRAAAPAAEPGTREMIEALTPRLRSVRNLGVRPR